MNTQRKALEMALAVADVFEKLFRQAETMHKGIISATANIDCQICAKDLRKGLYAAAAIREALAEQQGEPVRWKHDCAALLANDVELWIDKCPHCGMPRTAPEAPAPSQQAAPTALAWMRQSIYLECKPKITTLRKIADEWIAEGYVVTALGPLSQELSDSDIWQVWEGAVKKAERTGTLVAFVFAKNLLAAIRAKNGGAK